MSFPMFDVPEHFPMPINDYYQGPETDERMIAGTICWCGDLASCTRYRTGKGKTMNRIPPAARQLIAEIAEIHPDAEPHIVGDPDGFGVYRQVQFTKAEWLADALEAIGDDRIASVVRENQASTLVTFTDTTRADYAYPYDIADVHAVLLESDEDEDAEQDDGDEGEEQEDASDPGSDPGKSDE